MTSLDEVLATYDTARPFAIIWSNSLWAFVELSDGPKFVKAIDDERREYTVNHEDLLEAVCILAELLGCDLSDVWSVPILALAESWGEGKGGLRWFKIKLNIII